MQNAMRLGAQGIFAADGNAVIGDAGSLNNPKTLFLTGLGGIYLPNNVNINYRRVTPGAEFVELWLDHGKNFTGSAYAYAILPAKTAEQTNEYAGNPDFEILVNNEKIQAVSENTLGITGYVFHQKGSLNGITVDKPCIVMTKHTGDTLTVTVSDPTQSLCKAAVTIHITGLKVMNADENAKCEAANNRAVIGIDFSGRSGLGTTVVFSTNESSVN